MKRKLSDWARDNAMTYRSAWNWIQQGIFPLPYEVTPTNRIYVIEKDNKENTDDSTIIYARVSNVSRKKELNYQVQRCESFCEANGWAVTKVYKEVASGMNDMRKELWKAIDKHPKRLIVENKDRLTRFGFNYLKKLLEEQGTQIVVINEAQEDKEDLIKDLASVIYSFCARLYGMRRAANKALKIKQELTEE